jgi:hypothetical protein
VFERKLKALLCHVSQLPDPSGLDERIRGWNGFVAKAGGLPDGHTAESFRSISTL